MLPEPRSQLVLREHVAYEGCLEAWRGTLDQSQVLAKLFLHEHIESAHREAVAYERFLSVPCVEGTSVPRYWGTYTYRGEFYIIVLEDTGPKLKNFRDCDPQQRRAIVKHVQKVHSSGLGFPATLSHFTCNTDGDIRVVDFGDSFEHRCDPENCEGLKKLVRPFDEYSNTILLKVVSIPQDPSVGSLGCMPPQLEDSLQPFPKKKERGT
ncbi:hypothetical protein EI94DRAFT_726141 [Lactarius quietus]|nr:hypothetical protein EI94DRAFT_726141 [Lactarius quietus]